MDNENNRYKPDWTPENAGKEFAVRVVKGVKQSQLSQNDTKKSSNLSVDDYVDGVLNNNRTLLAKTITLIESNSEKHFELAHKVLQKLLPHSGKSIRVGITGVPGAGKSTFIETLGMYLIKQDHKVAVLTVDPSSSITRGSILGDKTRMEKLSREPNCFIRPSPSGGALGGVARKSRETIIVCEAAGYDVILIETVGVGQSEITVRSMVDFFLLIMIAGAGDELQGIKRGVIEIADALLINKADGENKQKAEMAKTEFAHALHYLKPATEGWETPVETCSALTGNGIENVWEIIEKFVEFTKSSQIFEHRRKEQSIEWVHRLIEEELKNEFYNNEKVKAMLPGIKDDLLNGKILTIDAVKKLLNAFSNKDNNNNF